MADSFAALRAALHGRYEIERELGRGGMATVYLARDRRHDRHVAIKVLDPELASVLGPERFVREIQTVAALQHPHVLPLLDSGAEQGQFYSVTPYVEGESLRQRLIVEHQLPQDEAVRLTTEVAQALDYAHRKGIVHRDIKPDNILLADGHAMVADFGIARAVRESGGERLTQTGVTLGSPAYMSPEQCAGRPDIDGRSDLYNLGCTLYEMLAGQPPFTGPAESLAYQHLNLTPRPIRELRPSVTPAVEAALTRALAKTPADRFASAALFAAALDGAGAAVTPIPQPTVPSASPTAKRPASRLRVAAIFAVAAIGVLAFTLWRSGVFRRAGNRADAPRQWVWLAEFDGPADDRSLAPAARDLVAAALEQSKALAVVPREQVRIALHNAQLPDTTLIDGEVARQLAFRSSIPVVIEGRVGRLGSAYTLSLKATNAEDARVIGNVSGQAATERELVPALTQLARKLRRGLGEQVDAFAGARTWLDAPTSSFEAFKIYKKGNDLLNSGEAWGAVPLMRQAIAIDSAFATAWAGLGTAWSNLGREDSALAAHQMALRHADRLTPIRRYDVEAKVAVLRGDNPATIAAYDALLALGPSPVERAMALNNKALALARLGRAEEALALTRQAAEAQPVGPSSLNLSNIADQLIGMRRTREAREVLADLRGPLGTLNLMEVCMVERSWRSADSLASLLEAVPGPLLQSIATAARSSIQAERGELGAALLSLERVVGEAARRGDGRIAANLWMELQVPSRRIGHQVLPPPKELRGSTWGVMTEAVQAAEADDSSGARRALAGWPSGGREIDRTVVSDYVEATIDFQAGRWRQAVERLDGFARAGVRTLPGHASALRQNARWMMADAYLRLGRPDSAVSRLEMILAPVGGEAPHHISIGFWEPFVRCRLVRQYVAAGRVDDARRHWEILSATCTNPDPPVAALIADARAALQGTARP